MDCVNAIRNGTDEPVEGQLSSRERIVMERMLLELYCQYDPSLPFREVVSTEVNILAVRNKFNSQISTLSVLIAMNIRHVKY